MYTFGEDECGKLGLADHLLSETSRPQPVATLDGDGYVKVSCGARHTVAITRKGHCYAWGDGSQGQLGLGTLLQEASTPKRVEPLMTYKIVEISCGESHTAVVTGTSKSNIGLFMYKAYNAVDIVETISNLSSYVNGARMK